MKTHESEVSEYLKFLIEGVGSGCLYLILRSDAAWIETSAAKLSWWVLGSSLTLSFGGLLLAGGCCALLALFNIYAAGLIAIFVGCLLLSLGILIWVSLYQTLEYLNRPRD